MNSKKIRQSVKNRSLESNIKIRPQNQSFKAPKTKVQKTNRVSRFYFLSWGAVAALSIASVSTVVFNEGGVEDAIRTAGFNKINRQIAENRFANEGGDNLPTASIPIANVTTTVVPGTGVVINAPASGGGSTQSISRPAQPVVSLQVQPTVTVQNQPTVKIQKQPTVITLPSEPAQSTKTKVIGGNSAIIGTTYFSVYLGQSRGKDSIISLWYSIKNQNEDLFTAHRAAYYFDADTQVYNLVVGRFTNLGQSLKYCAELKFNDIACKYDSKFTNLQTTSIN